jgi:hypothetical protein
LSHLQKGNGIEIKRLLRPCSPCLIITQVGRVKMEERVIVSHVLIVAVGRFIKKQNRRVLSYCPEKWLLDWGKMLLVSHPIALYHSICWIFWPSGIFWWPRIVYARGMIGYHIDYVHYCRVVLDRGDSDLPR